MVPLILVGAAMQMIGQYGANIEKAMAEKRNAEFYKEQADYARDAMFREMDLAERKYSFQFGAQKSAAAAGGADVGSGSVSNILASTVASRIQEMIAIKEKGTLDYKLASLRGDVANEQGDTLGSFSYNALQAGSTMANAYAKGYNGTGGEKPASLIKAPGGGSGGYGSAGESYSNNSNVG